MVFHRLITKLYILQVYRLQGKGFHFALIGYRKSKTTTLRFEDFDDPDIIAAFTEPSNTGIRKPNEFQSALSKLFYQRK